MKTVWIMLLRAGQQPNGHVVSCNFLHDVADRFQPGMQLITEMAGAPTGVGSVLAAEVRGDELWAKIEVRPRFADEDNEDASTARLRTMMLGAREEAG